MASYIKFNGINIFWGGNQYGQCWWNQIEKSVRTPHLLELKEKQMKIRNVL